MVIWVVVFPREGNKIKWIFDQKSTYSKENTPIPCVLRILVPGKTHVLRNTRHLKQIHEIRFSNKAQWYISLLGWVH